MRDRTCILCRVYRPGSPPRLVNRPPVDDGCRLRLYSHIGDIADLTVRLMNPEPAEVDDRWYEVVDRKGKATGEWRRADPVAGLGGAGPLSARALRPPVSGSRAAPAPVDLNVVDLTAPARPASAKDTLIPATVPERVVVVSERVVVTAAGPVVEETAYPVLARRPVLDEQGQPKLVASGDQVGHQSAASLLDLWVRDWRDTLWPGLHLPVPTVVELTAWMRVHGRVDEACDRHPAMVQCAAELRGLRSALYAAVGEGDPVPEVLWGSLCKSEGCDEVSQLIRSPGSDYIECDACGRLYTEQEYRDWVRELAGTLLPKRGRRRPPTRDS